MTDRQPVRIPVHLFLLDGAGTVLLVLGVLAALGIDLGLPALASIWPLLIVLGMALMVPIFVWAVRRAFAARQRVG